MADLKKMAEEIANLTLKEAKELSDYLKDDYGIEPSSGGVVMAAPKDEEPAEPTSFKLVLKEIGDSKIKVIKAIREITNQGLKEAKDMTVKETVIVEKVSKDEGETAKKKLMEAGAVAELQPM